MGDSGIVKSGEVSLQVKSLLKSSWQKKFCVLYNKTAESHAYMELYDDRETFNDYKQKKKKCDIKKIDLHHVKGISRSSQTSGKGVEYLIEIRCKHLKTEKHVLMCKQETDTAAWFSVLNLVVDITGHDDNSSSSMPSTDEVITVNAMYDGTDDASRFDVTVSSTPLSRLCGMVGKRVAMISAREIAFEDPETKLISYTFQLSWMRRFGSKKVDGKDAFSFETGRKCPNGQGEIVLITEHSKIIHRLITDNSCSKETFSLKAESPEVSKKVKDVQRSPENTRNTSIGEPSLASNMNRKHPGQGSVPSLTPLRPVETDDSHKAKTRHSTKENGSEKNRFSGEIDRTRPMSGKTVNPNFTKELEQKLSHKPEDVENSRQAEAPVNKKKLKEEKKEKERKAKEEEKEKEKKAKEEEKLKKQREKEEKRSKKKEKGKDIEEEKSKAKDFKPKPSIRNPSANMYEEPDEFLGNQRTFDNKSDALYDEAEVPNNKQPMSKGNVMPAEYAQPYAQKGAKPVQTEFVEYSEVKDVAGNAWRSRGRGEEEEQHMEDYSNIKAARKMIESEDQAPPPVPVRLYDDDADDDTYNSLELRQSAGSSKTCQINNQNIYGTASAKPVGPLPPAEPQADYGSDEEETHYDDPAYEGYDTAVNVSKQSSVTKTSYRSSKETYDDTAVPKPNPKPRRKQPQEALYDEVNIE